MKRISLLVSFIINAFLAFSQSAPQSSVSVDFVNQNIVRIRFCDNSDSCLVKNETGVLVCSIPNQSFVKVKDSKKKRTAMSNTLIVELDKTTNAITFKDKKTGKVLLQEFGANPRWVERTAKTKPVYDESSVRTVQSADGQKIEKDVLRYDTVGYQRRYATSFRWQADEGIYGLGSHIEDFMNLRGKTQYLTQHNLKAMVPVITSNKGYGLLFDAGSAMTFTPVDGAKYGVDPSLASSIIIEDTNVFDYYFMRGNTMDDVIGEYRYLTGECPMMPRYLFGYTQSKERYCSQQEVVDIVKEYRRRQVPLDMVVQDWNYWPEGWGYMKMDPKFYTNPAAMADSVHAYNAKLMVSIWPNPQYCPQAEDFKSKGFMLEHSVYDAFSPAARDYYWSYADREFFSKGFDAWWCDCSEPLDGDWKNLPNGYGHGNHKERWESTKQVLSEALGADRSSLYSLYHAMGIYEHQRKATNDKRVVNLTRSSYAGQQRYSTITWNGDTYASWESFRKQIPGGLNFMATGCPYWSVDVGSFFTTKDRWNRWFYIGEFPEGCKDPNYREYYTRMFQWATFLPMLRSHGSDTPREIWRFGEPGTTYYDAILDMIHLRYRMLPYTYSMAAMVSRNHYTMTRLLAFDFPDDQKVLDIKDEFMFGPALLVAPVSEAKATSRKVYLPKSQSGWYDFWTNTEHKGGVEIDAAAPINRLPLFVRGGSILPMGEVKQYSSEPSDAPMTIYVYPGCNTSFTLYDDAGDNYNCEKGEFATIEFTWDDDHQRLIIGDRKGSFPGMKTSQRFNIVFPDNRSHTVTYDGTKCTIKRYPER